MIQSLRFENFKSWSVFSQSELGQLSAFFGTNSSGKTSVFDFLLLIKQTLESSDRTQVLNIGGDADFTELGSFDDLIHGHTQTAELSFEFTLKFLQEIVVYDPEKRKQILIEGDVLSLRCVIRQTSQKRLFVQQLAYNFAGYEFTLRKQEKDRYDYQLSTKPTDGKKALNIKRATGRPWPLPEPIKFHGFPDQIRTYYQNAGFLFDLQLAVEEFFQNVYYLGPLREYPKRQYIWNGAQPTDVGRRGEKCVEALLSSRIRKMKIDPGFHKKKIPLDQYVASWLKELGLIHDFSIDEIAPGSNLYQVKVRKNKKGSEVLITDVGFGVSQILPVITLCYYVPEGSTILIEQPEIHLHPRVQSGLADIFIDAATKRNIQIIVESHSEHFIRRLQRRIAERDIQSDQVTAFFCENSNGSSELTALDVDVFGNIRNWPKDFFGDEMGEIAAMTKAIRARQNEEKALDN